MSLTVTCEKCGAKNIIAKNTLSFKCISCGQQYIKQTGVFPTECTIDAGRKCVNPYCEQEFYPRTTLKFGELEPIAIKFVLWNPMGPIVNAPIKFYLNGRYAGTSNTDVYGVAYYIFEAGIPEGEHQILARFEGDWLNNPCEKTITITTIKMEYGLIRAYVESLVPSPSELYDRLNAELIKENKGAVIYRIEREPERVAWLFYLWVPVEPVTSEKEEALAPPIWAIILAIVSIVTFILQLHTIVAYIATYFLGLCQCGICGARFTTCEALRQHLITQHPEEWEKIKDRYTCKECEAPPTPPTEWEWVKWVAGGAIAVAAIIGITELIKTVKR